MKRYVIYKEVPLVSGDKMEVYYQDKNQWTTQPERAKVFDVRTILEILLMVLQLILNYRETIKYKPLNIQK